MARICPLFSGSSGNSYYIGSANEGILIDIGRSCKQITNGLERNNININSVKAIFITHEHADHVKGLRVFCLRYKKKVYASSGTINALLEKGELNEDNEYEIINGQEVNITNMVVKSFNTEHDCKEGLGYVIKTGDGSKVAFATDLGHITEEVKSAICGCETVIIESNHEKRMLQNGSYPYQVKQRIMSPKGHLSNDECADILPYFAKNGTTRFLLAHLSNNNNLPQTAYQTAINALESSGFINGIDFKVDIAPKENTDNKIILF
eukprot:TRINITY_DN11773_c0_g1_i3.p1 TRINITY_DN11773_c0_g1~~TRINITY_DN11773_c0_g1_i3.p1  ORF type:complete len:265 (+),score=-32.68 TRINITY_DN11773_c0_g1_i3:233-1027(+)